MAYQRCCCCCYYRPRTAAAGVDEHQLAGGAHTELLGVAEALEREREQQENQKGDNNILYRFLLERQRSGGV